MKGNSRATCITNAEFSPPYSQSHAHDQNTQSNPQVKLIPRTVPAVRESFTPTPDDARFFAVLVVVAFPVVVVTVVVIFPVRLPKAPSPPWTALGVEWPTLVVVALLAVKDLAVELAALLWMEPPYGWPVVALRYQFAGGSFMHSPYRAVV